MFDSLVSAGLPVYQEGVYWFAAVSDLEEWVKKDSKTRKADQG